MMDLQAAAQAMEGRLFPEAAGAAAFSAVTTDTRRLQAGELYIALRGDHFDGHDFVDQAFERGAVAAVVAQDGRLAEVSDKTSGKLSRPLIRVHDTRRALGQLAASWRKRFERPLIGITGSNGKTTVKEMVAAILRQQYPAAPGAAETVLATQGNLNNDIGLPLMLLRLQAGHRAAVLEMGMNHPGEIDYLSRLAAPDVVVVNNAQRAHLAGLGSLEAVARAKAEIFHGLRAGGTALINADDEYAGLWRELAAAAGITQVLDFGLQQPARVHGICQPDALGSRLDIATPQGKASLRLQVPGEHNARNALAAAAACLAAGVDFAAVVAGLQAYRGVAGRLQPRKARCGARLIDDSYNANPDSLRAAIDVLAAQGGRRILVLGDMGETGASVAALHAEIGGHARRQGIDELLALGEQSARAVEAYGAGARHFARLEDLLSALRDTLDGQATVLVKGSRFMRMERVVEALAEPDYAAANAASGVSS